MLLLRDNLFVMNNILPKLINEFCDNMFLNRARLVYFKSAATTSVLEEATAKAEAPATPEASEVTKAKEVAEITAETNEAVAKTTNDAPEVNEPEAKVAEVPANTEETVQASSDSAKEVPSTEEVAPVHDRSTFTKVLIWPYWVATKGATEWVMGGRIGRYLDKKGQQLGVMDDWIMALANFPWGPVKLPYWVITRILGVGGKVATGILSAPGRLLPDVDNPFPSEK